MLFCDISSSIFLRNLILDIQIVPDDLRLITLFLIFENNKSYIQQANVFFKDRYNNFLI